MRYRTNGARARRLTALAVCALVLATTGDARAQDGSLMSITPASLELADAPGTIEVRIDGAPAISGYELELTYDPSLAVITAIDDGGFLGSGGGVVTFTPRFAAPDRLAISAALAEPPEAGAATAPSGSGSLARITFAPVAEGGPATLGLARAGLVGVDGEALVVDRTVGGEVLVVVPPSEAMQTQAVAEASALATAIPASGGFTPEIPDVGSVSAEVIWLGLLVLALAVVIVGWAFGRRPA